MDPSCNFELRERAARDWHSAPVDVPEHPDSPLPAHALPSVLRDERPYEAGTVSEGLRAHLDREDERDAWIIRLIFAAKDLAGANLFITFEGRVRFNHCVECLGRSTADDPIVHRGGCRVGRVLSALGWLQEVVCGGLTAEQSAALRRYLAAQDAREAKGGA